MPKVLFNIFFKLCFYLFFLQMSSCSYEKTNIDLGSSFDSTWSFQSEADYTFDNNLVEIVNGQAQLKSLNLRQAESDLQSGVSQGLVFSNSKLQLLTDNDSTETHVNELLPSYEGFLSLYMRMNNEGWSDSSTHPKTLSFIEALPSFSSDALTGSHSGLFDGSSVTVAGGSELDPAGGELSISAWVKPNLTHSTWAAIIRGDLDSVNFRWPTIYLRDSGGDNLDIHWAIGDGSSWCGPSINDVVSKTQWSHITLSFKQSSGFKIFVNSKNVSSNSCAGISPYTQTTVRVAGNDYEGQIDELAVWQKELTQADVTSLYEGQRAHFTELSPVWTPQYDHVFGHWKFDSNLIDSSGKGNHGDEVGSVSYDPIARVGKGAALLDGSGDAVTVPHGATMNAVTTEVSISTWIYLNQDINESGDNNYRYILKKGAFAGSSYYLILEEFGSGINFNVTVGGVREPCINFMNYTEVLNRWAHVAAAFNTSTGTCSIYLDGVLKNSRSDVSIGNIDNSIEPITIGGVNPNVANRHFPGKIDSMALWSSELSASDVSLIYHRQKQKYAGSFESAVIDLGGNLSEFPGLSWQTPKPFGKGLVGDINLNGAADEESLQSYPEQISSLHDGLLGYWPMNEAGLNTGPGGVDFTDASGRGHHGVEVGGVANSLNGYLGNAAQYNGLGGDYISVSNIALAEITNAMTVSFWMKANESNVDYSQIMGKINFGSVGWSVSRQAGLNNLSFRVDTSAATNNTLYSTAEVFDDSWHHITLTLDNGNRAIYIDGVLDVSDTYLHGAGLSASADLRIGTIGSFAYSGLIDEVGLWNRALSSQEVTDNYQRGANRVKVQVKSCIDVSCNCKDYNASPQGNSGDCDGDGLSNALDSNDSYKSEFIGPGGTGETYYTENFNRPSNEINFNCSLNVNDNDSGLCHLSEITFTGGTSPAGPSFLRSSYAQFILPPAQRYLKYRVLMEAEDNLACSGAPCLPELNSLSFNPNQSSLFISGQQEVRPKSTVQFKTLKAINISADACARFRIESEGADYYYNGTAWALASTPLHTSTATDIENEINLLLETYGVSEFKVVTYLSGSSDLTQNCTVSDIDILYEN